MKNQNKLFEHMLKTNPRARQINSMVNSMVSELEIPKSKKEAVSKVMNKRKNLKKKNSLFEYIIKTNPRAKKINDLAQSIVSNISLPLKKGEN